MCTKRVPEFSINSLQSPPYVCWKYSYCLWLKEVAEQFLETKRLWRKFYHGMFAPFLHFFLDICYWPLTKPEYWSSTWLVWSSTVSLVLAEVAVGRGCRELAGFERCCLYTCTNKSYSKNAVTFILHRNLFWWYHYWFNPKLRWRQVYCLMYISVADITEVSRPALKIQENPTTKKIYLLD